MASRGRTAVGKAFLLQVSILFLLPNVPVYSTKARRERAE